MFWRNEIVAVASVVVSLASSVNAHDFGRPATSEEIKLWDIDVRPDGKGLPEGSGTVARGKSVYAENCEACHGPNGQGGIKDRLVGGQGSLATDNPIKRWAATGQTPRRCSITFIGRCLTRRQARSALTTPMR